MTALSELLDKFRTESKTEREKGTYFEGLVKVFLTEDKRFQKQFSEVYTFGQWAKSLDKNTNDTGIDLVAKNIDDEYYTAIQCKFYDAKSLIAKKDIDSFIAASDTTYFTRRILIDTTERGFNDNVANQLEKSNIPFMRLSLNELENSSIDWSSYNNTSLTVRQNPKKQLRPHQKDALLKVQNGFNTHNRGKLIMACGTGKTFTALKIAENIAGKQKSVLFLVPSLALMSQTITDWCIESDLQLHAFAVCSDTQVGKRRVANDDISDIDIHDLVIPATTDAKHLALSVAEMISTQGRCRSIRNLKSDEYINKNDGMLVIFATYQSIEVVSEAQLEFGMPEFDLIICDEAHRTTGARLNATDESEFVKIHNNDFIRGKKRLYMTATPRVYIEAVKTKASEANIKLYSMDDITHYGEVFYSLKFGEAVESGLLSDYKVVILVMNEEQVARDIQRRLSVQDELKLDDVSKIIGCYKALIKSGGSFSDTKPMQKVVAFCNSIKNSKLFVQEFKSVVEEYLQANDDLKCLNCELDHVDGKMNALEKTKKLNWLKETTYDTCRILSNARCLSEGVDVPSLDAVMFIHARKSKVDIVQSVGRVMRKSPGKNMGYVILPIGIPAGVKPEDALKDHASYSIVYDVLNALRSHDERLDAKINQASYGQSIVDKIEIISYINKLPEFKQTKERLGIGEGSGGNNDDTDDNTEPRDGKIKQSVQNTLDGLELDIVQQAMTAQIVKQCGTRTYWEDWANDIAEIAGKHISRIKLVLGNKDSQAYKVFTQFVNQLRDNLNESITNDEVIEMLAQHIITKPVFNALFSDYNFTEHNSISKSMQSILDILDQHNIDNEAQKLDKFYASVKRKVDGIATIDAKQQIIVELYDKFFRNAFPRMTERLGIVYTPVECVDFIIHSVNDILKQEFNQELGDKNTHIIDPFTGTGTFITRLMQSGLLSKEQLEYKYNLREKQLGGEKINTTEIHANELILLAYYIASINIESVYHAIVGGAYKPFDGICLTDTFQLSERDEDLITPQLADNNHRRKIQKKVPIRVFIGNPPYSAGQSSGNDNNQNLKYPKLDMSIKNTYVKHGNANNNNSLYDSYIRAIRWASDRIDKYGVIGFITNAGWINSNSADGMRKCLKDEFSSIYIFHLRGGIRGLNGDRAKKEGQNVFDIMTAVAITLFIKNPQATKQGKIYFYDIGDYLTRDEKFKKISSLKSINNITLQGLWQEIIPDKYNDWLNQRDDDFYNYIAMGNKKTNLTMNEVSSGAIFENFTRGLATSRDAWVYNYSKTKLTQNVSNMIDFYNSELDRYKNSQELKNQPKKLADVEKYIANFVNNDSTKIAWTVNIRAMLTKSVVANIEPDNFMYALYRPFTKVMCYFNKDWNERTYQLPKIFPEAGVDNLVIGTASIGANSFSVLISNIIQDLHTLESASQCFPFYLYEPIAEQREGRNSDLFITDNTSAYIVTAPSGKQYIRREAITDAGLKHFIDFYNDISITKEDIFYYIYGLLHSPEYKQKYADNLTKDLPRIPRVKTITDFRAFVEAGRKLKVFHTEYEEVEPHPVIFSQNMDNLQAEDYRVIKMQFANKADKSKIVYNSKITLENIPLEAYNYVVNGKSAIEWVMERQGRATHKESGIVNDANDWAVETMNNPHYPLELLQRIITVSLETIKIVNNLPMLTI